MIKIIKMNNYNDYNNNKMNQNKIKNKKLTH